MEATKPLLYGTVFVLLALTFLLNLTGVIIRSRTRSRQTEAYDDHGICDRPHLPQMASRGTADR